MNNNDEIAIPITLCAGCLTPYTLSAYRELHLVDGVVKRDGTVIEQRQCVGCDAKVTARTDGLDEDLTLPVDRFLQLWPERAHTLAPRRAERRWSTDTVLAAVAILGVVGWVVALVVWFESV
jgi:hypothetical protein